MEPHTGTASLNPWVFVRIAAVVLAMLVFGLAGLEPGVRTVGALFILFAAVQGVRRVRNSRSACQISGQLALPAALTLAGLQAAFGLVMLVWPGHILALLPGSP